jgi:hypothetical protein
MGECFRQIVACDFEYEVPDGDLPDPLAMVAHVLEGNFRHVRTIKLWRGEFPCSPPFDVGPDTLFVSYSAWAEMMCFKMLGWKFPTHIFDQHTAYLAASNLLLPYAPDEERKKDPKNFEAACAAYGIKGWDNIDKEDISRSKRCEMALMPAPISQPTHSAFAGAGATMAVMPMPAAPISAMNDLCMYSPSSDRLGPIQTWIERRCRQPRIPLHH